MLLPKEILTQKLFVPLIATIIFNPFAPNAPFLYPLKTSENRKVFWCFQGVEKGCIWDEWANKYNAIKLLNILEQLEVYWC